MLKELRTKNYRKAVDSTLPFYEGFTVWRGSNECGKTTRLEAIAYALFGSTALRDSVDDAVTWGEAPTSMRVELDVVIDGQAYTFKRGKSGAEVLKSGKVFVTGQRDVTEFASNLLGADAKLASNLMMAGQNQIRGALAQGPTAAAALVENLADFGFFDDLFEKMSENLVQGSDSSLKDRLGEAQTKLEEAKKAEPVDVKPLEAQLEELEAKRENLMKDVEAQTETLKALTEVLERERKNEQHNAKVLTQHEAALERLVEMRKRLAEEKALLVDTEPLQQALEELRQAQAMFESVNKVREAVLEAEKLKSLNRFKMTETEHMTLAKNLQSTLEETSEAMQKLHDRRRDLERQIQKDLDCSACGRPFDDHEAVVKRNKELEEQIAILKERLDEEAAQEKELVKKYEEFKAVKPEQVTRFCDKFADMFESGVFELNTDVYPAEVVVLKDVDEDVKDVRDEIVAIEKQISAAQGVVARVASLEELEQSSKTAFDKVDAEKRELVKTDVALAQENVDKKTEYADKVRGEASAVFNEANIVSFQISSAVKENQLIAGRIEDASKEVASLREELNELRFNNNLIRKVRKMRPEVTDKLWNLVLAAVSRFFSDMRGTPSVVTKDAKGFRVDGKTVESLSGSTLDILALSLRVALTKTFLPNTRFMLLDEVTSAADPSRTLAMLGFLKSSGFDQIVFVTHDNLSETVADHLVVLGE